MCFGKASHILQDRVVKGSYQGREAFGYLSTWLLLPAEYESKLRRPCYDAVTTLIRRRVEHFPNNSRILPEYFPKRSRRTGGLKIEKMWTLSGLEADLPQKQRAIRKSIVYDLYIIDNGLWTICNIRDCRYSTS